MAEAKIKNLVCKECGEKIKRTVFPDRLTVDGNAHGEKWECPNGHDTSEVLIRR